MQGFKRRILDSDIPESITRDAEFIAAVAAAIAEIPLVGPGSRAVLSHREASDQSGDITSGAWRTRDLNTIENDPDGIVSLLDGKFTLQAGTYRIRARSQFYACNSFQSKVYNETDDISYLGTSGYSGGAGDDSSSSEVETHEFTIASAKVFQLQGNVQSTTGAGNGWGVRGPDGISVFAFVVILKVA